VSKISDVLKKSRPKSDAGIAPPKLKAHDWEALLQYSKTTGKLRLHSNKVIKDPGTVHRLLANKLILPDGRLTRQAVQKCEALSLKMRTSLAGRAEDPIEPPENLVQPGVGRNKPQEPAIEPDNEQSQKGTPSPRIELSDADWTILMSYNRQTGHLLRYDAGTGQLDQGSLEILRDTGAVRRLLKYKMIHPGGKLTFLGKRECRRRERGLPEESPAEEKNNYTQQRAISDQQPQADSEEVPVIEPEPVARPELLIPAEKMPPVDMGDGQSEEKHDISSKKIETRTLDKNLISLLDPQCFESEQFKILRTNIFVPTEGKAPRSLLVTSVAPGEGKSFVAANLAVSVANAIDRHVLLMDCDLRRPTIHKVFGFGKVQGLSDYLTKGIPLTTLLQKTKVPKLTILPAGHPPPNPAELLSSGRMSALVDEVSARYSDRLIIVDSPPPRLTAETFVLASQVDGVVLVVKYGSTPREMVAELITKMGKDRMLGCVLNHFDVRTPGYRYRYYGKYYGKYTLKKKKSLLQLFTRNRRR